MYSQFFVILSSRLETFRLSFFMPSQRLSTLCFSLPLFDLPWSLVSMAEVIDILLNQLYTEGFATSLSLQPLLSPLLAPKHAFQPTQELLSEARR
jgi:hypothetical protein